MRRIIGALVAVVALALAAGAAAQDHSRIYTKAEIAADAQRLRTAALKIYALGLEPQFTDDERRKIGPLKIVFPEPQTGDYALDSTPIKTAARAWWRCR